MRQDPLLGRGPQLAALSALVGEAAGSGRLVLLAGEAGIGKTSLVRHFLRTVPPQVQVLTGGCDALRVPRPLGPFQDIAAQWEGRLAGPLQAAVGQGDFREQFLQALQSALRRTVIVIEDVHWADSASLDLLRFLARRIDTCRALVIVTYRHDSLNPDLRLLLGDVTSYSSVSRLSLQPLSETATAELAGGRTDALKLHRLSGGNPFFITELLAALPDELPPTVQDAVLARVARLPAAVQAAVRSASVIGSRIPLLMLLKLGHAPEAIEQCETAGFLHNEGGDLVFRHDLVRRSVHESLSVTARQQLHRQVLAVLELPDTLVTDPAVLARHALGAGDPEAVVRFVPPAARAAARLGAHRQSFELHRACLQYQAVLPEDLHAQLLDGLAAACDSVDETQEAIRARRNSAAIWEELGRTERQGRALAALAMTLAWSGDNAAAERAARDAVRLLEKAAASPALALAYRNLAALRMLDRDVDGTLEWGAKAIRLAEQQSDWNNLSAAHLIVGCALLMAGREGCTVHLELARNIAAEHELHEALVAIHANLGSGCGELYRFAEAEESLRLAVLHAEQHEERFSLHYSQAWLALVLMYRGQWDEAAKLALSVLSRPGSAVITRITALTALGRVRARRGDPEVWPILDEALELAGSTRTLQRVGPVRAARAEAAWLTGDPELAGAEAAAAWTLATKREHPWFTGELAYWLWQSGRLTVSEVPLYSAAPFRAEITGDPLRAAQLWVTLSCPYESARAQGHARSDSKQVAAFHDLRRLGAGPESTRLEARLRAAGVRVHLEARTADRH